MDRLSLYAAQPALLAAGLALTILALDLLLPQGIGAPFLYVLGLPIVKRDVEAHGGEVSIVCPDEGGAQVTISLPLGRDAAHLTDSPEGRT